jgi:hypothetical protein
LLRVPLFFFFFFLMNLWTLRSINDVYLDLLKSVKIDRLVKVNWFIVVDG